MVNDVVKIENYYIRYDEDIGIFLYSCKNGLIYAYSDKCLIQSEKENLCKGKNIDLIVNKYFFKDDNRLLPSESYWPGPEQERLKYPITINWLITKQCTHHCLYCYASDVMNNELIEQTNDLQKVAEKILSYKPLCVVISGGEPFLHNKLKEIIYFFAGKTGIIIDTNGFINDKIEDIMPILKKEKVVVRVSLDNLRIAKEYLIRKPRNSKVTLEQNVYFPLKSITTLQKNDVRVVIQTVLTKKNANDLISMGDKLVLLGIKVWRIFELQVTAQNKNTIENSSLEISKEKIDYFTKLLLSRQRNKWKDITLIFTTANGANNNVILVLPNGQFYTEGKHNTGKINLDDKYPFKDLSWGAHFSRYID